jgi:hypothetical protein
VSEVGYALALGLAVVFAWAGLAKLRAPRRTVRAFRTLGVSPRLARVVPLVELALAVALVVQPTTALAAAALVAVFTIVLARAAPGVACACFGSASTEPVSWVQLLRNGMLAAVAITVAVSGAEPAAPGIAAALCAIGITAIAAVILALADLKRRTGTVVAVSLP